MLSEQHTFNSVVVILKVIERCNINCSYCYFFNGIDDSYKSHAARIKLSTVQQLADYFKNACSINKIKTLRFDFHGGEPLLLKTDYLASICDILIQSLNGVTNLEFTLQTNAMLINPDWIELFNRYKINLGISIDGPAEYHDKYRIDHKGKGTHQKTTAGIDLLRSYARQGKINFGVGALCVINPEFSAKKIYRHFVDDLKLNSFDFLLPDNTWNSIDETQFDATAYGKFLIELFDEWKSDNNPKIYVRILNSVMSQFLNTRLHFHDFGGWIDDFLLITVSSNGDIGPDDTYRSASPELMQLGLTLEKSTFSEFLQHPTINWIINSAKTTPDFCQNCCWLSVCKGGSLLHRYSNNKQFDKQSVYCEGLKLIFKYMQDFVSSHQIKIVEKHNEQVL